MPKQSDWVQDVQPRSTTPVDREIRPKTKRAARSAAEWLRIVEEYDSYPKGSPERGALLLSFGIYTSAIAKWRKLRQRGALKALATRRPGPKPVQPDPVQTELSLLRAENARLQVRLAQAETIIDVQKSCAAAWGASSTSAIGRDVIVQAVTDLAATTGVTSACALVGMPRSTYYRRARPSSQPPSQPEEQDHSAAAEPSARRLSPRVLTAAEREQIRALLNSERFADLSPREVYATLIDEGVYHCSWSTMYRLLRETGQARRRRDQPRPTTHTKPELLATRPRQLWSWDITKLKGPTTWTYFYLYVILDVFSRYVLGWMIALRESAELAEAFIAETCATEQIAPQQLTIHADRGSAMTSKCVAQLLVDLGVAKTHSRPHVSNDNPFSEAQFKTAKYHSSYPERFGSLEDARAWARPFFLWYNQEHHHSALELLTPAMVHQGQAEAVLAARQQVLLAAYEAHSERFVRGAPQPMRAPAAVWINPPVQQFTSIPETIFPLSERSSPDQSSVAAPSRGFTAQRPLDGAATLDYAVAQRPAGREKATRRTLNSHTICLTGIDTLRYYYFRKWRDDGCWQRIHDTLRAEVRRQAARHKHATAGCLDSQSVKTSAVCEETGYDSGKQIKGRKRHLLVDTIGLLIAVVVTAASLSDAQGAKLLFARLGGQAKKLRRIWVDGTYRGKLVEWVLLHFWLVLQPVLRSDDMKGFVVLPKRWVIERTFAWLTKCRRLGKDYERLPASSEAMIYIAMTRLMLRRLAAA